jgi:hypothetical protein
MRLSGFERCLLTMCGGNIFELFLSFGTFRCNSATKKKWHEITRHENTEIPGELAIDQ